MARISWLKWPDPIIDYGRELYVPWRISAGEVLYRDIPHLYGPLAHHVNALLFTLFGTGLRTLAIFNLLLILGLTLGIYGIFRRAFDRLTATLCGIVFLGVFAFARYDVVGNYNFVCPYSHEVTYGIALFFLMAPTLARYHERRAQHRALVSGLLLGLIFLTKLEVFAAALASAGAAIFFPVLRTRSLKHIDARAAIAFCGGVAAPPLLFGAFFALRSTVREAAGMITASFSSVGLAPIVTSDFYRLVSGLAEPRANILLMFKVAAVYLGLLLGVVVLAKLAARVKGARHPCLVLGAILPPLGTTAWLLTERTGWLEQIGRPWPFFLLLYTVWLLWSPRAGPEAPWGGRRDILRITVSVFALVLLLKIVLRVDLAQYGFALSMPAAMISVAVITHHLPRTVERWGGDALTAKVSVAALVLCFVLLEINVSREMYELATYPVGSGSDRFYTFRPSFWNVGPVINETLAVIEARVPENAGFVVIPEGVMLNYLARRRNPGKWFEFTPPFVAAMGEERMRADLEAGRPEYVVLVDRQTAEYGAKYFGTDYGLQLRSWVMEHYTPVHLAGSRVFGNQGFGIAIAERKAEAR